MNDDEHEAHLNLLQFLEEDENAVNWFELQNELEQELPEQELPEQELLEQGEEIWHEQLHVKSESHHDKSFLLNTSFR